MLHDANSWCLVTHYKENYSLFPALLNFYRTYYGIRRFFILCGLTKGRTHDSLAQFVASKLGTKVPSANKTYLTSGNRALTVSEFLDGDSVLWIASHPAKEFTPEQEFHTLRLDVNAWGESFLPAEISKTLVIDTDEFLYVQHPQMLSCLDNLGFHFLDIIPSPTWPPASLSFSLQGWYYRRQSRPAFKYCKSLTTSIAKALRRGLQHNWCKTYYFDRKRMGTWTAWHHGTLSSLSCCFALDRCLGEPDRCQEILRSTACCYHLAMTCKDHFLRERLLLSARLQTDLGDMNRGRSPETTDLELAASTFDRTIAKSIFPVIQDNFLLPYLQNV